MLGLTGEQDARTYLEAQGMTHVASNWHCRAGELDLIMLDGEELAIIEVKARRGERNGRAEESIGPSKARKLLASAEWFVSAHDAHHHRIWRIDLLALTYDGSGRIERIAHIPNAIVTG